MSEIFSIKAKEITDSRKKPTMEVLVETEDGFFTASVPSGASTGNNEAVELRDEDGSVLKAVLNVNKVIAKSLKGKNPENQKEIDQLMIELDGTDNKSKLGANAILGVSMAVCRAGAKAKKTTLYNHIADISGNNKMQDAKRKIPLAMFNIINGGAHVHNSENKLDIQEFMVVPQNKTFRENLVSCNKIFQKLKEIIENNFGKEHLSLGDEGGFSPPILKTEQALLLLKNAIGEENSAMAIDVAASQFFKDGKYKVDGNVLTRQGMIDFYKNITKLFKIISIEDPFEENDFEGFKQLNNELRVMNSKVIVVGDDLTTTNPKIIKDAHARNACNGVILKLNQIGTVSETIDASNLAKSYGWKTIVSHRSGETMDSFIADFAVGTGADFLKAGSPAKEERMVKYSRLLEIENELK